MKILSTVAPVVTARSGDLPGTVRFYEALFGRPMQPPMKNPAGTLDLVRVGPMLVIGGSPHALATRRDLKATFVVDDLDGWRAELARRGCAILEEPAAGPVSPGGLFSAARALGRFMFVRHPDGALFEYFEPS